MSSSKKWRRYVRLSVSFVTVVVLAVIVGALLALV